MPSDASLLLSIPQDRVLHHSVGGRPASRNYLLNFTAAKPRYHESMDLTGNMDPTGNMDLTGKKIAIFVDQLYQEMEVWYSLFRF